MHIVSFAVFVYYFNCMSFAIRLSGRKGRGPIVPQVFGTPHINANQTLHDDKTGRETFYSVDHAFGHAKIMT